MRCWTDPFARKWCCLMARTQDVVELILEDHRRMEELFRRMRSVEADRAAALREFADLLIAHALAEEAEVYPALKRYKNIDDEEVEHGEHEHDEGNKALLDLLEVGERFRGLGREAGGTGGGRHPPRRRGGTDHPQRSAGERGDAAARGTGRGVPGGT